jgi:hypothetical protein
LPILVFHAHAKSRLDGAMDAGLANAKLSFSEKSETFGRLMP